MPGMRADIKTALSAMRTAVAVVRQIHSWISAAPVKRGIRDRMDALVCSGWVMSHSDRSNFQASHAGYKTAVLEYAGQVMESKEFFTDGEERGCGGQASIGS